MADSNADAIRELAQRGVLSADLGAALASAAGFRNVLVHQYVDVDDARVVDQLGHLGDLDAFVVSLLRWLEA